MRAFIADLISHQAEAFSLVADRIEAGESPADVARSLLKEHHRVIFKPFILQFIRLQEIMPV